MTALEELKTAYQFDSDSIILGKTKVNNHIIDDGRVRLSLKMMNRHGLIAGATGTGKTKTVQLMCEQLSNAGVPTVMMDIKGDFSGISQPWNATHPKILERYAQLARTYEAMWFPTEFFTLDDSTGVRIKSTVTEFWPLLMAKVLDCNDTQSGVLSVLFHIADEHQLPLVNLDDLKTFINRVEQEWNKTLTAYGSFNTTTLSTIIRKIIALESQWWDLLFAEPSFDINDWIRHDAQGRGVVNVIRLLTMQDKPQLFVTFMLGLLAEMFEVLPEVGDMDKPKLIMIIDEAHLIFSNADKHLLHHLETTIKLIRSKGVWIFFCTQVPGDIPDTVLSQLGTKIQHALRAFTARDHEMIRKAVKNYPITDLYELSELITSMGIGEAMITTLDEKGRPTPVAHTFLLTPASRMDVITDTELEQVVSRSSLTKFYNQTINTETAHEILSKQLWSQKEEKEEKQQTSSPRSMTSILKSKFATTLIKSAANAVVRGVFEKMWIKVDKRRNFF